MTKEKVKMVKVKYTGSYPAYGPGTGGEMKPGETRDVPQEIADILVKGNYEIVKK